MIFPRESLKNLNFYKTELYETSCEFKLDSNENNFGPCENVMKAIREITESEIQFYPCYGRAIDKIAKFYNLKQDNVLLTNGADEAINVVFQTYLDNNDAILTVSPTFSMPQIYAKILNAKYLHIEYEKKWKFPYEKFIENIKESVKIIHLTTPNNPTGDIIDRETICRIIEKGNNSIVVIDQTYSRFCDSDCLDFAKEYDNVIVIKSMSKDFALAGLRLGFIVSNECNINNIRKVISPYSVNVVAAKACIVALENDDYFQKVRQEIIENKESLYKYLEELGFKPFESFGNFILCDFGISAKFVNNILLKNGIKTKLYQEGILKNHLRITIPTKRGITKIKNILKRKDTIVFDMDGVLIDTSNSYRLAVKKTFEHFAKKTIELEQIQSVKNLGNLNNDWDLTQYLLKKENLTIEREEVIDVFQKLYFDNGKGLIENERLLLDKDLMKRYLNGMYNFVIFTGRPREEALFTLKKFCIEKYFDMIVTMDDLPRNQQKPDPLGLNLIQNSLLVNDIVYLGDTCDDLLCANRAKIPSIGVLPPQDKSDELICAMKKNKPVLVLNCVNEIIKFLDKGNIKKAIECAQV